MSVKIPFCPRKKMKKRISVVYVLHIEIEHQVFHNTVPSVRQPKPYGAIRDRLQLTVALHVVLELPACSVLFTIGHLCILQKIACDLYGFCRSETIFPHYFLPVFIRVMLSFLEKKLVMIVQGNLFFFRKDL